MFRRRPRQLIIKSRGEQHIDSGALHQLNLLRRRTDQSRCPIRREELDGMRSECHRNGLQAKLARSIYDCAEDCTMSKMQAVEVSDADHGCAREVRISQ